MKIITAIDSFKGSLNSVEAGEAIKSGILSVYPDAHVQIVPIADGGEGTVNALVTGMNGQEETLTITGPLNDSVNATYGILPESQTAIIEIAQASGLVLVPKAKRNPMHTTTYGVGELIKAAIQKGCRHFIIGLGGSATNDAGIGMLQALGFEFYNGANLPVGIGGHALNEIKSIKTTHALSELSECTFSIACDVVNPLYGRNGAAYIYGPQKGATPEIVSELDQGLINFSEIVKKERNLDVAQTPGAGAAGGLGYAFLSFLNAKLESGIDIIIRETKFKQHVKDADFVITGEGCLDHQTAMGKAPIGITKIAKQTNAKVIALAGNVSDDAVACNEAGIDAYFSIQPAPTTLKNAMKKEVAAKNIKNTTRQIFHLIKATKSTE